MARQQKMTDDDAAGHKPALIVEAAGACLAEHFPDGAFCRLKVLFRVGVAERESVVTVFDVGQINLYFPLKTFEVFDGFIAVCVADDRNGKRIAQRFQNGIGEMDRSDEIDVVRALCDEFPINLPQAFYGDFPPLMFTADFIILAVDATQVATGEEDGSRSFASADAGLFPEMEAGACNDRQSPHTAEPFLPRPINAAVVGAEMTFTHNSFAP